MDIFDIIIAFIFGVVFTLILIAYFESHTDRYERKNEIQTNVNMWLDDYDYPEFKFWSESNFNGNSGTFTIHVSKNISDKELSLYRCGYKNGRQSKI